MVAPRLEGYGKTNAPIIPRCTSSKGPLSGPGDPEAEAISGHLSEADADVQHASSWRKDFADRGGKLDDALRPVYIDYLQHHGDPA